MDVTSDDIVQGISEILRFRPSVKEEASYTFTYSGRSFAIAVEAVEALAVEIGSFVENEDGSVVTKTTFEVLAQTNRASALRFRFNDLEIADPQLGISYRLGAPSDAYAIYLCLRLLDATDPRQRRFLRPPPQSILSVRGSRQSDKEPTPVLDVIRRTLRAYTLRITSGSERPKTAWKQYADAFFFHVGYNLDMPLMPSGNVTELVRPARISSVRRSGVDELDVPHRHYVSDLVYHYQLGVSAESPMLEYISYYHVAEHWFESVYQDDLVEQIQFAITSPAFSYKRKQDLRDLIRKVSRAVQLRDDQMVINEQTALRLTLARHIDLGRLTADIDQYDPNLLDYYANHLVSFCGGDRVSFNQAEPSTVLAALAARIYKTRNALVHSKEGLKGRFVPFADDRDLVPEVPLMRFIAEQIITSTSSILD